MKPERYKHKKTGGIYSVICNANIEKTGELVVVYQNEKTGERWVRPADEFNDGRFERITGWTAFCPHCGSVEIVQKTKPKSCKTEIAVGPINTRRCGLTLTQQTEKAF